MAVVKLMLSLGVFFTLPSPSPSHSLLAPGDGGEGELNKVSASKKFQVEEIEMTCMRPQGCNNVKPSQQDIRPFIAGASTWVLGFWLEEKRLQFSISAASQGRQNTRRWSLTWKHLGSGRQEIKAAILAHLPR